MVQTDSLMIESYLPKQTAIPYAHKKGELKRIYENILKKSKNSAIYQVNFSKENQLFTFGIKDTAIALQSKIAEITESGMEDFHKKKIVTDENNILTVSMAGKEIDRLPDTMTLSVESLASPQVNRGKDLFHPSRGLDKGIYDFSIKMKGKKYDLSFSHQEKRSNADTIKKLAEYLTKSLSDITVTVEEGDNSDYSHITLKSDFTGDFGERSFTFEDSDDNREGIVDFFGLNHMEQAPQDARFTLNDTEKQTYSNTFLIGNTLQVSLKNAGEQKVTMSVVPDSKPILDRLDSILATYNELIRYAKEKKDGNKENVNAVKLINEFKAIEKTYADELEQYGITAEKDGTLSRDKELSEKAAIDGKIENMFLKKDGFIARLLDKSEDITINPMEYLDKTIVTYPDRSKVDYINPYITSMYSGLFFNSYC